MIQRLCITNCGKFSEQKQEKRYGEKCDRIANKEKIWILMRLCAVSWRFYYPWIKTIWVLFLAHHSSMESGRLKFLWLVSFFTLFLCTVSHYFLFNRHFLYLFTIHLGHKFAYISSRRFRIDTVWKWKEREREIRWNYHLYFVCSCHQCNVWFICLNFNSIFINIRMNEEADPCI